MQTLLEKKCALFNKAIKDMVAVEEDGELLLTTYLPKAKRLLEGGLWWKRASMWMDKTLAPAMKSYYVTEDEFVQMLEKWKEATLAGCRRMKAAENRRKGK